MPGGHGIHANVYNFLAKITVSSSILLLMYSKRMGSLDRTIAGRPRIIYYWLGYNTNKLICNTKILLISPGRILSLTTTCYIKIKTIAINDDQVTWYQSLSSEKARQILLIWRCCRTRRIKLCMFHMFK